LGIAERSLSRVIHFIHSSIEHAYSTRPTKNLVALPFQGARVEITINQGCARYTRLTPGYSYHAFGV
jgi:hypothetical protein